MSQFLPNRQHETTHQRTNLQSQTSAPTRSRVVPATPNPRSQSRVSPPSSRAAIATPNTRSKSPALPLRSKTAITSPTPRSRSPISQPTPYRAESATPNTHSNYSYTPMAYHTEHADTNGSHQSQTRIATVSPPTHAQSRQYSRIQTAKNDNTSSPSHYQGTAQTQREAHVNISRCNGPSMDDAAYTEPIRSNARVRQFRREAVETTRKPAYRANMKYSGRGEGSSRGTVVNIAGCDLAAFTKMGVGVDTFLGVHGEVMRNMMQYGKDYEANIDGEGPGAFYNVAGVGYNPNFGHSS